MVNPPPHPLRKWRLERNYTLDAAAAGVGTFRGTWYDWEVGRRVPSPAFMVAIYRFTEGAIEPNDFYDLPDLDGQIDLPLDLDPQFDRAAA
ncbi:MAG: helix-turn-helix transcriptional regulator [Pseudomonadota bacterium]|nr:helix-turn-helix transcriptional regulator [Pseudomonadota bacterium]